MQAANLKCDLSWRAKANRKKRLIRKSTHLHALKQNTKVRQTENEMCIENNKSPQPMNNKRDSIVKA